MEKNSVTIPVFYSRFGLPLGSPKLFHVSGGLAIFFLRYENITMFAEGVGKLNSKNVKGQQVEQIWQTVRAFCPLLNEKNNEYKQGVIINNNQILFVSSFGRSIVLGAVLIDAVTSQPKRFIRLADGAPGAHCHAYFSPLGHYMAATYMKHGERNLQVYRRTNNDNFVLCYGEVEHFYVHRAELSDCGKYMFLNLGHNAKIIKVPERGLNSPSIYFRMFANQRIGSNFFTCKKTLCFVICENVHGTPEHPLLIAIYTNKKTCPLFDHDIYFSADAHHRFHHRFQKIEFEGMISNTDCHVKILHHREIICVAYPRFKIQFFRFPENVSYSTKTLRECYTIEDPRGHRQYSNIHCADVCVSSQQAVISMFDWSRCRVSDYNDDWYDAEFPVIFFYGSSSKTPTHQIKFTSRREQFEQVRIIAPFVVLALHYDSSSCVIDFTNAPTCQEV